MPRLILIRHGETDYSSQGRYCGFSNPSLNKKGIWQAQRLRQSIKRRGIDKVYSSDLARAEETAAIVFPKTQIEAMPDFREMNFGIFEGLNYGEIIRIYPKLYKDWIENPLKVKIPKGESLKDLSIRVSAKLSFILPQYKDTTIALVTHAGPIKLILCDVFKFSIERFWRTSQDLGTLKVIDYD